MDLQRTTPPAEPIVSLSLFKQHLPLEHSNSDAIATHYLNASSDQVEDDSNRCMRYQVWLQTHRCFRAWLRLEKAPVQSVVVKYYDEDNVLQTVSSSNYYLAKYPSPCLKFIDAFDFPDIADREDAVQITMTCGETSIPYNAKQAVMLLATTWFNNPSNDVVGTIVSQVGIGYEKIINSLRRGSPIC